MRITDVIRNLQSVSRGSKELDGQVALMVGWTMDESAGEGLWISPTAERTKGLPAYTTNVRDASELAQSILPSEAGGFGWEDGKASAKIGSNQPAVEASTPALALCIASLVAFWRIHRDQVPTS